MQRGFAPISILIAILILILISAGAIYVTNKQNQKVKQLVLENIQSSPSPNSKLESTSSAANPTTIGVGETANWKTYSAIPWAKKYGNAYSFSIKYPPDWQLIENDRESSVSITLSSPDYQRDKSFVGTVIKGGFIAIIIEPNSTLDRWSNTPADSDLKTKEIISNTGNLGDVKIVEREGKVDNGNLYSKVFAIEDTVYEFRLIANESSVKYKLLLNQILSTFKFIP